MNSPIQRSLSARGFTLLEVLAVVAIIGILLAMLGPGLQSSLTHTRRTAAAAACRQIVSAVAQYQTDYGRLPNIGGGAAGEESGGADRSVGDPLAGIAGRPNSILMNTLRAIRPAGGGANAENPRETRYLDLKLAKNQAAPKDGSHDSPSEGDQTTLGCYFDSWGTQYNVIFDSNADQQIDLTPFYTGFQPIVQVGAFSLCEDRKLGEKGNRDVKADAVSWR
jgi:prepilin-type N-terminal cleavage/methylation domain-containing protein